MSHALDMLDLSYVKRWVVAPTYREQSVAEHTFRVMCIALHLLNQLGDLCYTVTPGHLLLEVMGHDVDERLTGDIPGPVKSAEEGYLRDIGGMSRTECLVKVADSIETGTFWMLWGNPAAWSMHPYNCAPARDISKIQHYAARVPGLLEAAHDTWRTITGTLVVNGATWTL